MKLPPALTKKIGPLPVYGYAGIASGIGALLAYRKRKAEEAELAEEEIVDQPPSASSDEQFLYYPNVPGFTAGNQIFGNPQQYGSTMPADQSAGPSIIVTTDNTTPEIAQAAPPPPAPNRADPVPQGYTKATKLRGRKIPGMKGYQRAGTSKSKKGTYQIWRIWYGGKKIKRYHEYTSGKNKGKWTGPF